MFNKQFTLSTYFACPSGAGCYAISQSTRSMQLGAPDCKAIAITHPAPGTSPAATPAAKLLHCPQHVTHRHPAKELPGTGQVWVGGCSHQQSGCSHMVFGGEREEPYGCTLYHVRLRKQDVTHFSDCHRCCLWVSVYCSTFSFHLFTSEHTTALTWALIFPDVQIWDTSLHLSMYFGFPRNKHSRRKVYICTMSPWTTVQARSSAELGEWQQLWLHVSHLNLPSRMKTLSFSTGWYSLAVLKESRITNVGTLIQPVWDHICPHLKKNTSRKYICL